MSEIKAFCFLWSLIRWSCLFWMAWILPQGHHWERQADTDTVNFHTFKHKEFFCFTVNLIFLGRKRVLI